eukprot:333839-Amphidinium_carterae.1
MILSVAISRFDSSRGERTLASESWKILLPGISRAHLHPNCCMFGLGRRQEFFPQVLHGIQVSGIRVTCFGNRTRELYDHQLKALPRAGRNDDHHLQLRPRHAELIIEQQDSNQQWEHGNALSELANFTSSSSEVFSLLQYGRWTFVEVSYFDNNCHSTDFLNRESRNSQPWLKAQAASTTAVKGIAKSYCTSAKASKTRQPSHKKPWSSQYGESASYETKGAA